MLAHTGHWAASIARAPTTPSTPTTVRPGAEAARPQPQNFLAPNGTVSERFQLLALRSPSTLLNRTNLTEFAPPRTQPPFALLPSLAYLDII